MSTFVGRRFSSHAIPKSEPKRVRDPKPEPKADKTRAELVEEPAQADKKRAELVEEAESLGITVPKKATKAAIQKLIDEAPVI